MEKEERGFRVFEAAWRENPARRTPIYLVNFKKFVCKGKCLCMQWKIKMEAKIHGSSSFSNIQNLYFKVL
jgi:hypothetical protein